MATKTIKLNKPHPAQRKVIRQAARFNVLQCGRRFGKTTLGMQLAIETALQGKPVAWFAPTYPSLLEVWKYISTTVKPIIKSSHRVDRQIVLVTKGLIDFWSLTNPDSGRGRKYARVIIDEASVIPMLELAWQQTIRPMLTDFRGDAWFLGTPKGRNFFHHLYLKEACAAPGWKSWRMGTVDNPFISEAEVADARRDLPQHVYEQEYLGVPADDGANPFGIDAIAGCLIPELSTGAPVVFGVDLAKSQDWTVICGLDVDGHICRLQRMQGPWNLQLEKLAGCIGHTPALIDSTGVGDPILERLQQFCAQVHGFKFTSHSKQQLMEGLTAAIHRREVGIVAGWIQEELECFEYQYTPTGVRYSAPYGLHDDGVCALALAVQHRAAAQCNVLDVRIAQDFTSQPTSAPTDHFNFWAPHTWDGR